MQKEHVRLTESRQAFKIWADEQGRFRAEIDAQEYIDFIDKLAELKQLVRDMFLEFVDKAPLGQYQRWRKRVWVALDLPEPQKLISDNSDQNSHISEMTEDTEEK